MQTIDIAFLQQYIKLDSLLGEMTHSNRGVSDYLEAMEAHADEAQTFQVYGWDEDYHTLHHLRHLRNLIAHEASEAGVATREDLEKLQAFHHRASTGDDPFARFAKAQTAWNCAHPAPRRRPIWPGVLLGLLFLGGVGMILYSLYC